MLKSLALLLLIISSLSDHLISQDTLVIAFKPILQSTQHDEEIEGNSLTIDIFKCYISDITFLNGDDIVSVDPVKAHLLDMEDTTSMAIVIDYPQEAFDQIRFNLGIDSLTSVSGVFGGDLDPINGMFWTWNTGYINLKIEGTHADCETRKNRFQYHIGGYMAPYQSLQQVVLDIHESEIITIDIDIYSLLQDINFKSDHTIMSPSMRSQEMSQAAANVFKIRGHE